MTTDFWAIKNSPNRFAALPEALRRKMYDLCVEYKKAGQRETGDGIYPDELASWALSSNKEYRWMTKVCEDASDYVLSEIISIARRILIDAGYAVRA